MISLYRKYLKGYWKFIILTLVFVIVQIVFQIKLMSEMKLIIQNGVGRKDMAYIIHSGVMMLCFTLGQGLCTVGTSWFSARATTGFTQSLRRDCFKKVLAMSEQDYLVFGGGTLTTRTLADTNQLQKFTLTLLRSALTAGAATGIMDASGMGDMLKSPQLDTRALGHLGKAGMQGVLQQELLLKLQTSFSCCVFS